MNLDELFHDADELLGVKKPVPKSKPRSKKSMLGNNALPGLIFFGIILLLSLLIVTGCFTWLLNILAFLLVGGVFVAIIWSLLQ